MKFVLGVLLFILGSVVSGCELQCENGGTCFSNEGQDYCLCPGTFFGATCQYDTGSCDSTKFDNAAWPATSAGEQAVGVCEEGFSGSPVRLCKADGTWDSLVSNRCTQNKCPSGPSDNAMWPSASAGQVVLGKCLDGFVGNPYRSCGTDGSYLPVQARCYPQSIKCPALQSFGQASWPQTNVGTYARGICQNGKVGTPFLFCKPDGTWATNIDHHCQDPVPTTQSPTQASVDDAPPTTSGAQSPCPQENFNGATWPETPAGETATGLCKFGHTGSPKRTCGADGVWSLKVQDLCVSTQPTSDPGPVTW